MSPVKYDGPSNETRRELELETRKILDGCMKTVEDLLHKNSAKLEAIANALVEKETLYYEDVVKIMEPQRSDEDIQREIRELAERKLIGKRPLLNLDWVISQGSGGSNGGGSGSGALGGEVTTNNFTLPEDSE